MKFIVVHIVPTGIGASIGGYAGDATPVTNLIAGISDFVITHPNVVNAANFYCAYPNVLYVEGYMLDEFLMGNIGLKPVRKNKIGVVIDKSCKKFLPDIINAINASKMTAGIDILDYIFTDKPINGMVVETVSGYGGKIENADTIIKTCDELINKGAQAIAVFSYIKDIPKEAEEKYQQGKGPDPVGIIEALISRLISYKFNIPCAHAPVFPVCNKRTIVYERAAAEETGFTYIPCVLMGLSKAPLPVGLKKIPLNPPFFKGEDKGTYNGINDCIFNKHVSAIVLPADALGGVPALSGLKIPIIAVKENTTVLNIDKNVLKNKEIIEVKNYLEAVGLLVAIREGIKIN